MVNISLRITLYELLRLFKPMREALREAFIDSEIFLAQIPKMWEEEVES